MMTRRLPCGWISFDESRWGTRLGQRQHSFIWKAPDEAFLPSFATIHFSGRMTDFHPMTDKLEYFAYLIRAFWMQAELGMQSSTRFSAELNINHKLCICQVRRYQKEALFSDAPQSRIFVYIIGISTIKAGYECTCPNRH